jgi:hypothetical protein
VYAVGVFAFFRELGFLRELGDHSRERPISILAIIRWDQLGHSDIRTTLDIYTQITDPEVARMVNQVTNRILGLGEEGDSDSVQ